MIFGGIKALRYYLRGVNEIIPTCCYICHPNWLTSGTADVHSLYSDCEFGGNRQVKAMLRDVNEFLLLLDTFLVRLG